MSVGYCSRCVYSSETPNIVFDEKGVCNYCKQIDSMEAEYPTGAAGAAHLAAMVEQIRRDGRGKKYDCVIGVSGGCDSSFLVGDMVKRGLRPLAVHFDNTWNSAISTQNIYKVLKTLKVDLYTIVVNNKEYDDIYRAFLEAGVADIEAPTDIGLATTLYLAASKYKIGWQIEGHSFRTEGISPLGWLYMDGRYIASVHKRFGTLPMETFPNLWLRRFLWWSVFARVKKVRPLYYIDYQKEETKKALARDYGWQWYGGHHLENRFTAFYHTYFLPRRFGFDTRANGYAALVRSGQMNRKEAIDLLEAPQEYDPDLVEMVKRRLGYSDAEFERLMTMPRHTYREYPSYKHTFELLRPLFFLLYKADLVPKSFYMKYTAKHAPLDSPDAVFHPSPIRPMSDERLVQLAAPPYGGSLTG